jgi:hypothetical protein
MNQREDQNSVDTTGVESPDAQNGGVEVSPVDDEYANAEADEHIPDEPREPAYSEPSVPHEVPPPAHPKSVAREYFESMVVTFVMAIFGMTFITQAVNRR